jgi:hypothetical protein
MPVSTEFLGRLLEPVGRALGTEAARRVLALRADPELQRRMDELAERANEGLLTADERGEYEALIATATVVAVLQAKARAALAESSAA